MKKTVAAFCAGLMLLSSSAYASQIKLTLNNSIMNVNGIEKEVDPGRSTAPLIENSRTLVPIRAVAEEFGAIVDWNAETEEVTVSRGENQVRLTIGSTAAFVNGSEKALDAAPIVINDRTFMPARFIFENLGLFVGWDSEAQSVTITDNPDDIIFVEIGGMPVTLADFNLMYYSEGSQYALYLSMFAIDDWETAYGETVKRHVLSQLSQLIAAEKLAHENGLIVDENRTSAAKDEKERIAAASFEDEEGYKSYLNSVKTTDAAVERYILYTNLFSDLFAKLTLDGAISLTDDEIGYNDSNYFKVKHVLVSVNENRTDEAALSLAKEVIEKLNAGAEVDALIKEYNDDPGMSTNDYYIFTEGEMVDEFYEGTKALEIGKWSDEPVKSAYGYHVILRYPLSDKDDMRNNIISKKLNEKFMDMINNTANSLEIVIK